MQIHLASDMCIPRGCSIFVQYYSFEYIEIDPSI